MESRNKWLRAIGSPNTVESMLKRALDVCNEDVSELDSLPQNEKVQKYREAVDYLVDCGVPFHEIPDLINLVQRMIAHMEKNRELLLETGYPKSAMAESPWLNGLLCLLLPTKMPLLRSTADHIMGKSVDSEEIDPDNYDFCWVRETGTAFSLSVLCRTIRDMNLTPCSYNDAALLEGLSPDDAIKLELLRPRFFNVKVRILKEALVALKNMDAENFFESCIGMIKQDLTPEEISFISRIDDYYLNYSKQCILRDSRVSWIRVYGNSIGYSGFRSLFKLIGHVIKEVKFRSFDNFTGSLLIWESEVTEHPKQEVVYRVPWAPNVEMIVKLTKFVEEDEKAFWKQYPGEIRKALFEEAAK
jgi:hypothetical protein